MTDAPFTETHRAQLEAVAKFYYSEPLVDAIRAALLVTNLFESPPWRSLERMYQETYPDRDVVASDVLRWADTFIAARRHE